MTTSSAVGALAFSVGQDSAYTLTRVAITVPAAWTWSHQASDVALAGSAFTGATASVSADSVIVDQAAVTASDSGTVTIANLGSPAVKGGSVFVVRTAVTAGALTQITTQPSVRVLELVPIVSIHVNDASGVPIAPYAVGSEATLTGVVTANFNDTQTNVFLQDGTGAVNLFSFTPASPPLAPGDSVTVTGSIVQFRGLIELSPEFPLLVRHASAKPLPARKS